MTAAAKLWAGLIWVVIGFFIVNVFGLIAAVVVNSFATRWLGTWLPAGFTLQWYGSDWSEFQIDSVLIVTLEIGRTSSRERV
jgi:putative spermidine/putrescine transport system permease protein